MNYSQEDQTTLKKLIKEDPEIIVKQLAVKMGRGEKSMAGFVRRMGYNKCWVYTGVEESKSGNSKYKGESDDNRIPKARYRT